MIFDLNRLKNKLDDQITIDLDYQISEDLLKTTEIISPCVVHLKGKIMRDSLEGFLLDLLIEGNINLPCSVTLKPVSVPISVQISGNLDEFVQEIDENQKKIENSIDILPIIWENILMEIPMKVTSPDAYSKNIEGDGWKLVTEESTETTNPALEQLKDLL